MLNLFSYVLIQPGYQKEVTRLKIKLHPESVAETSDGFIDVLKTGGSESCAEEHLALANFSGHEPATSGNKDLVVNSSKEDLFFNLITSLACRKAGMLLPINANPVLEN